MSWKCARRWPNNQLLLTNGRLLVTKRQLLLTNGRRALTAHPAQML